jgi:hypothetical protein
MSILRCICKIFGKKEKPVRKGYGTTNTLKVSSADWKKILETLAKGLAELVLTGDTGNMDFGVFGTEIALKAFTSGKKFDMTGEIDLVFTGADGSVEIKITRPSTVNKVKHVPDCCCTSV